MKKYILTSLMSLFLVVGAGLMLTATETETKKETAKSCCSEKATETAQAVSTCTGVEKTQTAATTAKAGCADKSADAACCSSKKETKASAESDEVQMIQTSSASQSSCTGSAAAASCTGSKTQQVAGPQPGECTKVPSGIRSQQASREN